MRISIVKLAYNILLIIFAIMNIEEFREYCLAKKAVSESFPFGGDTLVFKVMGKMFALTGIDSGGLRVNLKCDPAYAETLRTDYPEAISGGYHMSKKYWNTVDCEHPSIKNALVYELIDHSYYEVLKKLTKKEKATYESWTSS